MERKKIGKEGFIYQSDIKIEEKKETIIKDSYITNCFAVGYFYESIYDVKYNYKNLTAFIYISKLDKIFTLETNSMDTFNLEEEWNEDYFFNFRSAFIEDYIQSDEKQELIIEMNTFTDEDGILDIEEYYLIISQTKKLLYKSKLEEVYIENKVKFMMEESLKVFEYENSLCRQVINDYKKLNIEKTELETDLNKKILIENEKNDDEIVKFMLIYKEKERKIEEMNEV